MRIMNKDILDNTAKIYNTTAEKLLNYLCGGYGVAVVPYAERAAYHEKKNYKPCESIMFDRDELFEIDNHISKLHPELLATIYRVFYTPEITNKITAGEMTLAELFTAVHKPLLENPQTDNAYFQRLTSSLVEYCKNTSVKEITKTDELGYNGIYSIPLPDDSLIYVYYKDGPLSRSLSRRRLVAITKKLHNLQLEDLIWTIEPKILKSVDENGTLKKIHQYDYDATSCLAESMNISMDLFFQIAFCNCSVTVQPASERVYPEQEYVLGEFESEKGKHILTCYPSIDSKTLSILAEQVYSVVTALIDVISYRSKLQTNKEVQPPYVARIMYEIYAPLIYDKRLGHTLISLLCASICRPHDLLLRFRKDVPGTPTDILGFPDGSAIKVKSDLIGIGTVESTERITTHVPNELSPTTLYQRPKEKEQVLVAGCPRIVTNKDNVFCGPSHTPKYNCSQRSTEEDKVNNISSKEMDEEQTPSNDPQFEKIRTMVDNLENAVAGEYKIDATLCVCNLYEMLDEVGRELDVTPDDIRQYIENKR